MLNSNDQLIQDVAASGELDGVYDLFCIPATSAKGNPCLQVREADVRKIGLPPKLQNKDVAFSLRECGYTATIHRLEDTNAVNVPVHMASSLKKCGVARVDIACEQLQNE